MIPVIGNRVIQSAIKSTRLGMIIHQNELTINSQSNRYYSEKREAKLKDLASLIEDRNVKVRHMENIVSFGIPGFRNGLFAKLYLWTRMPAIDPKFNKEEFMDSCKEATIVFCNLIAENRINECEELMTPKAYGQLVSTYSETSDEQLARLRLNNENIDFQNLIFFEDFKKDDRSYVEATYTILKKNAQPEFQPLYLFCELFILKFVRDYTDGKDSNTDWLISYFDHKFFSEKN